jgi:hypothetical protein
MMNTKMDYKIAGALLALAGMLLPQATMGQKKTEQTQPPPPVAKSGPSFEATRDWMVSTLSQYGGTDEDSAGVWYVYSNVDISNECVLTLQNTQFQSDYKSGSKPFESWTVTIPIGAVTNAAVNQYRGDYFITLQTGGVAALTMTNGIYFNDKRRVPDSAYPNISLDIGRAPQAIAGQPEPDNDIDMAKRFTTAFQHMMDICKGTYQDPAQPKQPF